MKESTVPSMTCSRLRGTGFTTNSIQRSAIAQIRDIQAKAINRRFVRPFVSFRTWQVHKVSK